MEKIVNEMKEQFTRAMSKLPAVLKFEFGEPELEWEVVHLFVFIKLMHPESQVKHELTMLLSCYDEETVGIDYQTEDGDVGAITPANIMTQLYFSRIDWNEED